MLLFLKYLLIFLWGFIGVLWHLAVKANTQGKQSIPAIIGYYRDNILRLANSTLWWCGFFGLWWAAQYWGPFVDHVLVAWLNKFLVSKFGEGVTIPSLMFLRSIKWGGAFILVGFVIDSLRDNKRLRKIAKQTGILEEDPGNGLKEPAVEGKG